MSAMSILANLFTWPFIVGMVTGFLLDRGYRFVVETVIERHRGGWSAIAVDPRWFAGAIAVGVGAWSIFQTQANADQAARITTEARQFAQKTRDCQRVLIDAINDRAAVTKDYNAAASAQRDALADWLRTLLQPPPDIAELPGDSAERQRWAVGVTRTYFNIIERSRKEQADDDDRRPPLPTPTCPHS